MRSPSSGARLDEARDAVLRAVAALARDATSPEPRFEDLLRLVYRALVRSRMGLPALDEDERRARAALDASDERSPWRDAPPEWLGLVYEQLLELAPRWGSNRARPSSARRSSGAYYTPEPLIEALLDRALEPLIRETIEAHREAPARALLALRIVDPACGAGHVLLAAARRLAGHVARFDADAPGSPEAYARALSRVARSSLFGLDVDPTAVELARAALWLEAGDPSLPSTAWDAQILRGDALIGAAPPLDPRASSEAEADAVCAQAFSSSSTLMLPYEVEALRREHAFFHWPLRFPDVFARGGFDAVLGNPPWIAHVGRAAQPLSPDVRRFYEARHEAFRGYRTTHGLFVAAMPRLLREGGRLGFIVPSSLAELDGYRPTRLAHDRLATFDDELIDLGEGRFPGVTQPSMALVSRRSSRGRCDAPPGAPWPVERPDLTPLDRALLARLDALPTLPSALFGERGLQTDRTLRAHVTQSPAPTGRFTCALREGADVREFELLAPRFHADPIALGRHLRSLEEFREVRVLIRQTARFPIAARSDGGAFRNSLLAAFELPGWPPDALVALLNSALVRWLHHHRFRDARQPILPQVKLSHLRRIPIPEEGLAPFLAELARLGARADRLALDRVVVDAYALSPEERDAVMAWHERAARPPRARA